MFYYFKLLKAFVAAFSISQQVKLLVFIIHCLFFKQRAHSVVCNSKRQSTRELFQRYLHNAQWLSLYFELNIFQTRLFELPEKREKNKCGEK